MSCPRCSYDDVETARNGYITPIGYGLVAFYSLTSLVAIGMALCQCVCRCKTERPQPLRRPRTRMVLDAIQAATAVACMGLSTSGIPCRGKPGR